MIGFFREGLWIPLLLLGAAAVYALWIIYRSLNRLRERARVADEELRDLLEQYQTTNERVEQAASLIDRGEPDRAIRQLKEIQRMGNALAATDCFLGKAYLARDEKACASEHLRRFIARIRPQDAAFRHRIEEALRDLKRLHG